MTDIRAALEEAVRVLSGGHPGYVGDHAIRTVQVRQDTVDRLRAALAAASPEPDPIGKCGERKSEHVRPRTGFSGQVWGHDWCGEPAQPAPAASPDPERCAFSLGCGGKRDDPQHHRTYSGRGSLMAHDYEEPRTQPAPAAPSALSVGTMTDAEYREAFGEPAAPSVEALTVERFIRDYDVRYLREPLLAFEAAARADERTRLPALLCSCGDGFDTPRDVAEHLSAIHDVDICGEDHPVTRRRWALLAVLVAWALWAAWRIVAGEDVVTW